MADDFAGLKQTITDFLNAVPADKAVMYQNDAAYQLFQQLAKLFRARALANGITL